jgi:hypothetical protein
MSQTAQGILVITAPSLDGTPGTTPPPVSGLVLQTWRDGWTYCKATAKYLDRHQWVPWLSAAAALTSAATGTVVFASLQTSPSRGAQIAVGSVAVAVALITALQGWAASRIKALSDQRDKFHEFHRRVQRDIEQADGKPLGDGYADRIEKELASIAAGMVRVGNRSWDQAKQEMKQDMKETCPHLWAGE